MAVKNAIYKVDNGSGYDEIYFKTLAEQVMRSDGKTIQDFFDNGGSIGNFFELDNTYQEAKIKSYNKTGMIKIEPNGNFVLSLHKSDGSVSSKFSVTDDGVYFGDYFKNPNGYAKLQNGLILQWGCVEAIPITSGTISYTVNFPIAFPNAVVAMTPNVLLVDRDSASNVANKIIIRASDRKLGSFSLRGCHIEGYGANVTVDWIALGY